MTQSGLLTSSRLIACAPPGYLTLGDSGREQSDGLAPRCVRRKGYEPRWASIGSVAMVSRAAW